MMGRKILNGDTAHKTTAAIFTFLLAAMAGAEAFGQAPPNAALENTPAACRDGVDNDADGLSDCVDRDCGVIEPCAQTSAKVVVADPPSPSAPPYEPQVSMSTGRTLLALGTVFTVIGITLTGVGAWAIATVHCWDCPTDGFPAPGTGGGVLIALGLLHLIPGLPMLLVGASRLASYNKAMREQMALENGRVLLTPSLAILPEGGAAGALTIWF